MLFEYVFHYMRFAPPDAMHFSSALEGNESDLIKIENPPCVYEVLRRLLVTTSDA